MKMFEVKYSFKKSSPRGGTPIWDEEIKLYDALNATDLQKQIDVYLKDDHFGYHKYIKVKYIKPLSESPAGKGCGVEDETIKQIASIAWKGAANAYRLYPENSHTFSDYWSAAKNQFKEFASHPQSGESVSVSDSEINKIAYKEYQSESEYREAFIEGAKAVRDKMHESGRGETLLCPHCGSGSLAKAANSKAVQCLTCSHYFNI